MKSLIWKEARQQLVWFLVALAFATLIWFRVGNVWDQLVRPVNETMLLSLAVPLLYAFTLAQLQFGRDDDTRHFGLLVHRAQGARGYFASKVIVGVAALAGLIVLPVSIWAVAQGLTDADALLIHWSRVPAAWLVCLPSVVVYAIGVVSTQLRRGAFLRWGCAICGIFGSFLIAGPLGMVVTPGPAWRFVWVVVALLLAAAVLWLARSLLLGGRDRDLPLRDRHLAGIALVAFLVLLPFASFVIGTNESSALGVIVEGKPAVLIDPQSNALVVATWTEDGWKDLDGGERFTKEWSDQFETRDGRHFDLVHYSGSSTVRGSAHARDYVAQVSECRSMSDPAPRAPSSYAPQLASARAQGQPEPAEDEGWTVQCEFDADDGTVHFDVSRAAQGLPPMQFAVARPGRGFSPEAGFLSYQPHSPLVLDRADGTLWRVRLRENGALAVPLELPGGDRVVSLEPLFRAGPATLGQFEQHFSSHGETNTSYLFVGGQGSYVLLDGRFVPFGADSRPKDTVTSEEASALARYSVVSTWPDAFTEEIRVEQLPDRKTLLELSARLGTRAERRCAAIFSALQFLRPPGGVVEERFAGRTAMAGWISAPFPKERSLFAHGGHPLLFALLMLSGSFQLFLGWRWLARGGVGIPTRVVYMLLILVGGVAALVLTRLLLPRHVRSSARLERQSGLEPLPARA